MVDKVFDEYLAKTELDNLETDGVGTQTKKVSMYGFDTTDLEKKRITVKEIDGEIALETNDELAQGLLTDIKANQTNGTQKTQIIDGLNIGSYDYFSLAQDTLTDTYTFKVGGASGTTVATVLITYTSADKSTISSVLKS